MNMMTGTESQDYEEAVKMAAEDRKNEFVDCDFCGEPVRIGHYCPECSRLCDGDDHVQ